MEHLTKEEYRKQIVETIKQINEMDIDNLGSTANILKTVEILNSAMRELYMLDNGLI